MKYKYKLIRNDENKQLIIQEYIKIEGEAPFLLYEGTYELETLEKTLQKEGKDILKSKLRNDNIYPPSEYMTSLVTTIIDMLTGTNQKNLIEISFDDKEINAKNRRHVSKDNDSDNVGVNKDCIDINKLQEDGSTPAEKN